MPDAPLTPQMFPTYLKMIGNAPGTRLFNSFYVQRPDGTTDDVYKDGEYSCAAFVTGVLTLVGFLDRPCATVAKTEATLLGSGWLPVPESGIEKGDVIFWAAVEYSSGPHRHVGFALSKDEAVSTSDAQKEVVRHAISGDVGGRERKIEKVLRAPEVLSKRV